MIRKTKHPANRGERIRVNKKKQPHDNASPVYKLLKEKELRDAEDQNDGELHPR